MTQIEWKAAPPDRDPGIYRGGLRYLVGGKVLEWTGARVGVRSPVFQSSGGKLEQRVLGDVALVDAAVAKAALDAAARAYDRGRGTWPTASVVTRIGCMADFLRRMEKRRQEVSQLLCWEIAKPWSDALAEFDRTVEYGWQTLDALKALDRQGSGFAQDGGFFAQVRRSPYGVALCMGPYNYPLNETFATLLPAIVSGNSVIVKLPRIGMLCNLPLLEDFAAAFPPGVVNILHGEGPEVIGPIMQSGQVDLLAFIGSARVANLIRGQHPRPNRLRSVLGLGAKNPAIVLRDADVEAAAKECVAGCLTFNGQRCTALKILFVQRPIAERFAAEVAAQVARLRAGVPFEDGVSLTPLPDEAAVARMRGLAEDATSKGARILNPGGGEIDRTFFQPAVLYPIDRRMQLWMEEQFGPLVAIAPFDDPAEVLDYLVEAPYGQQASVFGKDPGVVGRLLDALVNQVCRVNLNTQCRRGPDTFPFGGRKDSAEGTLSITDALRVFSIRTIAAGKDDEGTHELVQSILRGRHSRFLTTDYLF